MKNALIASLAFLLCAVCNSEIVTLIVLLIGMIAIIVAILKESEAHSEW